MKQGTLWASVGVGVLAASVGTWHVLKHRSAVRQLRAAIQEIQLPDSASLSKQDLGSFLKSMTTTASRVPAADTLEQRRQALEEGSSWLQRLSVQVPSGRWKQEWDKTVGKLGTSVPGLFLEKSKRLSADLLRSSESQSTDTRRDAAMFKAQRAVLRSSASELERALEPYGVQAGEVVQVLDSDLQAREIESWIDRVAENEQQALNIAREAMTLAERAGHAGRSLRQDAPSREIALVVTSWQAAAGRARAAMAALDGTRPPSRLQPLCRGLLAPARREIQNVKDAIDGNVLTISAAYRTAVTEESTVVGRIARFGRRTARSAREFISSTAAELEARSAALTQALSASLDQAVLASAQVVSEGMQTYQRSRQPAHVRFLQSEGGIGVVVGVCALLLVGLMVAAAIRR